MTPNEAFFKRNHFPVPDVDRSRWDLVVQGGLEGELRLSLEDVTRLPVESLEATLECAGNGRTLLDPAPGGTPWEWRAVSTARWTGTPLRGVLDQAGVPPDAVEVCFEGADGGGDEGPYARSLPVEIALRPYVLLVWEMNGEPLPREHGDPLRLLVAGWYGMASVKWLQRVIFLREPFGGPFQAQDYIFRPRSGDSRAVTRVLPRSLIVQPLDGEAVTSAVNVHGWAWSGTGPAVRVDVRVDGHVHRARLGPDRGAFAWRKWELDLRLPPGAHLVESRATDAHGHTQPDQAVWNEGGYENNAPHRIRLRVTAP